MHIRNFDPAGFFYVTDFLNLVIDFLPFTLHHRSGVNFIFQNPKYLNRLPLCMSSGLEAAVIIQSAQPFVLTGSQNPLAVQLFRNSLCAHAFQFSAVDRTNNICCVLIHHQPAFVPFIFAVTVHCIPTDELSLAPLHIQLAPNLNRNVPAVGIVQQIFEGNHDAIRFTALSVCVIVVIIDGDEPNPHHWENLFQILSHLNVVTAKSRQVLDYDAVDFAGFDVLHHLCKAWSLKIGSRVTIICIFSYQMQFWSFCNEIPDKFSLVSDAVAFSLISVLDRQPQIGCCSYVLILFLIKKQSH